MSKIVAVETDYPDADLSDADWTKVTWDLPPYRSKEFMKLYPDLDHFRTLPVYAAAVESGLILDDEWVGDYVQKGHRHSSGCGCSSTALLKAAPMPPTKRWVLDNEQPVAAAVAKVLKKWSKKIAGQIAVKLPQTDKADLRQLLRKDDNTDVAIQAILDAIELDGFAVDLAETLRPELEAAFKAGGISGAELAGFQNDKSIVEQIPEVAVAWAKDRAAELVGMSYVEATDSYIPNPNAAMSITDSTREGLRGAVGQALEEGWSADDLASHISNNYAFSSARAETVARTELAFAHVQGNLDTWDSTGVVAGKRWILADTHPGVDECDDNAEDDVISLDAEFSSGDQGPPAHPNCLCALEPVLSSDMPDSQEDAAGKTEKGDIPGHPFHGNQYTDAQIHDQLLADHKFAQESGEFKNAATLLRYIAALNPEATQKQFVAAAVAAGHRPNSAANRFRESRKATLSMDGGHVDSEGRHYPPVE